MASELDRDWNKRYAERDTPWDSGIPSREMLRVLKERRVTRGRAVELGCGSGTNAVALAREGFEVTGVDVSRLALDLARAKAATAGVKVNWVEGDVQRFGAGVAPFDFVFDRGCYHCCRRVDLAGYMETHRNVTRPGTLVLVLAGSINGSSDTGIPKVSEAEIRGEFAGLYEIVDLHEFHFEDAGGAEGPLGWSCLMRRR